MIFAHFKSFFPYRIGCFVVISVFSILAYELQFPLLERVAGGFDDIKTVMRQSMGAAPEPHPNLVVVTIDEPSINEFGRWPWDRKKMAALFQSLKPAAVVVMDIVFSEPSNPDSDQAMVDQIEANQNVILGYFLRNEATEHTDEEALDFLEECSYFDYELKADKVKVREFPYSELNIPDVADAALTCGFFTTEPDPDGLFRHYSIAYIHEGFLLPPIGIQAVRQYLNQEAKLVLDEKGIQRFSLGDSLLESQNFLRINFTKSVNSWSAKDVLSGSISAKDIKDKIVIVGVTEVGVFDMRPTPIDAVTPGVFLHYMAASNLLNNNLIEEWPALDVFSILFGLLLVLVISWMKQPNYRMTSYFFVIPLFIVISWLLYFQGNIWLREFYTVMPMVILAIAIELMSAIHADRQSRQIKDAFSSYVSSELVGEIIKNPESLKLGGDEKEISVLFSDLRNFTSMSEKLTPIDLVSLLNQIFDPMTEAILKEKGMLDKYIGDAIMAIFNAPIELEQHADRAVQAALAMVTIKNQKNISLREQGLPTIEIGIGVNTGPAVVGNMGSKLRFSYTAIGDAVNLSSRLEGMNKPYGTRILISENTKNALSQPYQGFLLRMMDRIRVAGKNEPVIIFEVMIDNDNNKALAAQFERALTQYFNSQFLLALELFSELAHAYEDQASNYFIARCEQCLAEPPPEDWGGVTSFKKG
ncbi:adenylate/guanylate cyclase domain-containing protein [Litoribacillus peritrichatus]|uniref:Adenylate/guanylate cyclase domain-containing protein n=1 Tax=Litoribacillus peritrichatus TaxID=718191 RepID=A0ABP7M0D3_9GAMM